MDDTGLSYKTLHNVLKREQRSALPSKIDDHFYIEAATYLQTLTDDTQTPSNPLKKKLLDQEHKRVQNIIHDIYHQREKKILLAALSSARGGTPDIKHLIPEERLLYDDILSHLTKTRAHLLPTTQNKSLEKQPQNLKPKIQKEETSATEPKHSSTMPTPPSPETTTSSSTKNPTPPQDQAVVFVQTDTPSFVGPDMKTYTLYQHDIVTIPRSLLPLLTKEHLVRELTFTSAHKKNLEHQDEM